MSARPIEVMIVEDSGVARALLERVLNADEEIHVAGCARSGAEAIEMLAEVNPDVVTMDIHMSGIDGYETTRRIMETRPVPVVIVSASYDAADVMQTFRAVEAGAVAMAETPPGIRSPQHPQAAHALREMVKSMALVRLVKRWPRTRSADALLVPPVSPRARADAPISVVAIGASTGGPAVLATILERLPAPVPVPVLIVQHIAEGFVQGLAEWLTRRTGREVRTARHGDRAEAGHVYLAPDGLHMRLGPHGVISCTGEEAENGLRPAVSELFRSVAQHYSESAIGILLTGMGRDGAAELKLIRDGGGVTFAQDRESSLVFGMPAIAAQLGAAVYMLPPAQIADSVSALIASRGAAPPPA